MTSEVKRPEQRDGRACDAVRVRRHAIADRRRARGDRAARRRRRAHAAVPDVTPADGWAAAAGVRVDGDVVLRSGRARPPRRPHRAVADAARRARSGPADHRPPRRARRRPARARRRAPDGANAERDDRPSRARRARARVHRVELAGGRLAVDGVRAAGVAGTPERLAGAGAGQPRIVALTMTPAGRRDALLLHRLADLQARTPAGRFPLGEGDDGRLRFSGGWTSGFWPGALWEAARLVPDGPTAAWALDASLARRGAEDTPIHDVGFMFGRSVVAAYDRLCRGGDDGALPEPARERAAPPPTRSCASPAPRRRGMIPTDATGAEAETIVDSLMNVGLLTWATRVSGDARYAALARTHATLVLGPAAASRRIDVPGRRRTTARAAGSCAAGRGRVCRTRRPGRAGRRGRSTGWPTSDAPSRSADARRRRRARRGVLDGRRARPHAAALRPAGGQRRAPRDSSAAAIAAAGMYRLARACRDVAGACATPARWAAAAGSTLDHRAARGLHRRRRSAGSASRRTASARATARGTTGPS